MNQKIATGKFRVNLALILSILALAISLVGVGLQSGLQVRIGNLPMKMAEVKKETADRFRKMGQDTRLILDKLADSLKYKGETE